MKLRIRADSLRLRLTRSEVEALRNHGRVVERTRFSAVQIFEYALSTADVGAPTASYHDDRIEVLVPREQALAWAQGDEVGIYAEQALPEGRLKLSIEKDFACLAPREGDERDSDAFPNPKAEQGASC